jgi:hypothetical protein
MQLSAAVLLSVIPNSNFSSSAAVSDPNMQLSAAVLLSVLPNSNYQQQS